MSKKPIDNALSEFFAECDEILNRVTANLTKLESPDLEQEVIDSFYRDVHTLKGSAQLFGFKSIGLIAHAIEASLEPVRSKKISLDKEFVDHIFKCIDLIDQVLKEPKRDLENDPQLQQQLATALPRLVAIATQKFGADYNLMRDGIPDSAFVREATTSQTVINDVEEEKRSEKIFSKALETKFSNESSLAKALPKMSNVEKNQVDETSVESSTIRVQVNLLDKLMNLVGEMVLTRNQVLQFARNFENNDFLNLTQRLDLVTTELQDNVMRTRMQPIGSIFSKFQRVVRDLSRDLGKNIELYIHGAETELDKSLIEAIKDPLTHIIRNSCDHGIESPQTRRSAGKTDTGTLTLKAFHEGGQMVIEISDDGKGIDPEKIKAKAVEKRVISPERAASMSDKEAQELIFAPGFSTAEQVSSVSGRGVGMDVVKTNVEKVGGVIELHSQPGRGAKLRLRIPLTLAIVPAMIIRSGNESFAIPQVKIQELIRVDMEERGQKIEKLQGHDVYRLRGQLLPLIACDQVMHPELSRPARSLYNIVVINGDEHPYGLVVDEICDTADIVVKPIPNFLKKADVYSGATIMGDGTVALIVDTQGVAQHSRFSQRHVDEHKSHLNAISSKVTSELTEFLFFKLFHQGTYAIPLVLVNRLEEFSGKDIDYSGEEKLVRYRGGLLPLITLDEYYGYTAKNSTIDPDNKLVVIVVSKNNRNFGLVIDEIIDIVQSESEISPHIKESKGMLGSLVAQDKMVVTVIDTYGIIDEAMGLPAKKYSKKLRPGKILLAEDTIFFMKQIKKVLESAGLEVIHAQDGAEALAILKKSSPGTFDLIVSDIEMPNMNGFNLAASIREEEHFKNIPLIALTTRFTETDQQRGRDVGFNKYLEKLKNDELLDAIDQLIGVRT